MESLLDPPQTSQSLLSADDLDILPSLPEDGDVARLQMFNHGPCTSAGLSIRILDTRSVDDAEREIREGLAIGRGSRSSYDLIG